MIVYHYTTLEGFNEINRTGHLKPSDSNTTMDAAYGDGWYFTDLGPENCDYHIANQCWRTTHDSVVARVSYWFKYDIDPSILHHTRDHVYLLKNPDPTLTKFLGKQKKAPCPLKPCNICQFRDLYKSNKYS
jgi:hypothetical protein